MVLDIGQDCADAPAAPPTPAVPRRRGVLDERAGAWPGTGDFRSAAGLTLLRASETPRTLELHHLTQPIADALHPIRILGLEFVTLLIDRRLDRLGHRLPKLVSPQKPGIRLEYRRST